jgi:protocatechuate 3,4-dioxygenase beta subunit
MIRQIAINWGQTGVEYNFGELLPGSISGRIHAHSGPDCDFDNPEILLEGVRVDLLDAQGNLLASTTTNAAGEYRFNGLRPGTYGIREHQPSGYFDGGERIGSAGGAKHDVAGDKGVLYSVFTGINITSDLDAVQYDFCEKLPASIAGRVHAHSGPDCDFENPEFLLAGVRIDLLDVEGALIATTTTDANGEYRFEGLPDGEYQVFEHQPSGYYDGNERIGSAGGTLDGVDTIFGIQLEAGMNATQYDFCEHIGVMLSGYVYHDRSNDGLFNRGGANFETGIAGVVVKLLDASGQDTGQRATTDAAGFYKFNNLAAGTYAVMEVHPSGWLDGLDTPGNLGGVADASPPGDMIRQIAINWGQTGVEYNFGELLPGSIRGIVVVSTDPDCDPHDGEPGIEGVLIELLDAAGSTLASTTTNALGQYAFTGLRPGTYSVREHQPGGYFDLDAHVGTGGGVRLTSNQIGEISVGSDQHLVDYDFCEEPPSQLSGYVFIDGVPIRTNDPLSPHEIAALRDGLRTPDDRPLAGVTLMLRDGTSGDPIPGSSALPGIYADGPIITITDANGFYQFTGLRGGTYAVVQVQPEGVIDNVDTPGALGGFAVNAVGLLGDPGVIVPSPVQQTLELFRAQFGNDAIVRIPLPAGQSSAENNFSEVETEPIPVFIPPPVPPLPPNPVFAPPVLPLIPFLWLPPAATIIASPGFYGGSNQAAGFTWHLSVVNAGWPRAATPTNDPRFLFASAPIDAVGWHGMPLDAGRWTLATVDYNEVEILREEIFGHSHARAVAGDFNGDGTTELGLYIQGQWYIDLNGNGRWDADDLWLQLGVEGDHPVAGDWDGDGKADVGIYGPAWPRDPWAIAQEPGLPDPANFPVLPPGKLKNVPPTDEDATSGGRLLKRSTHGMPRFDRIDHVFHFGAIHDLPVAGDWNGDGIRQIGVFHAGQWNLDNNGDGRFTEVDEAFAFGQAGDLPVVGDWNGDGIDEIGVYRAGKWLLDANGSRSLDAQDKVFELGGAGDQPVVGDWNDDGTDDPGVYRPAETVDRVTRRAG